MFPRTDGEYKHGPDFAILIMIFNPLQNKCLDLSKFKAVAEVIINMARFYDICL